MNLKNNNILPQKERNTVLDKDDLRQNPFVTNNPNFASNSKSVVLDGTCLTQPTLLQIKRWAEREKPAPPEWVVHHLLEDGAENVLGGEPGAGKSWVTADLAVSVATGTPFLGREVKQGAVLFVNFDAGENGLRSWAERAAKARGFDFADLELYYYEPDPSEPIPEQGMRQPAIVAHLAEQAAFIKPRLIIVDAFSTAFPGQDGNKGQDVVKVFESLRQLRIAAGGACVLLVDHTPKPLMLESKRRGISGSQQKHARARAVHIVTQLEADEVPGGGNVLEWRTHKINNAPFQEPFGIRRIVDIRAGEAQLTVCDLPRKERSPKTAQAKDAALAVLKAAGGQWVNGPELLREVQTNSGASKRTASETLRAEIATHPSVRTTTAPGRGAPLRYRWVVGGADDPEPDEGQPENSTKDLEQPGDLTQSGLSQIKSPPHAKNGFVVMRQRTLEEGTLLQKSGTDCLKEKWQAGDFDGRAEVLPNGAKAADLSKVLAGYFGKGNLSDTERHDLEQIARAVL